MYSHSSAAASTGAFPPCSFQTQRTGERSANRRTRDWQLRRWSFQEPTGAKVCVLRRRVGVTHRIDYRDRITSTRDCLSSVTSTYTLVRSVRYGYGMWRRPGPAERCTGHYTAKWNATGPKLDVVRKLYDRVQLSTVSPIVMLLFML